MMNGNAKMKIRTCIAAVTMLGTLAPLTAQTQVNLSTQSKAADFANFTSVRPLPTGTAFPSSCLVGQGFYRTDMPAGQNVFWCTSPNTFSFSQASSGSLAICQDNSGSGSAYTCTVPSLTSYPSGLTLILVPQTTNTGNLTLNASGIGVRPLLRASGNGIVAGELQAGNAYVIVYNGTAFVVSDAELEADGSGTIVVNRNGFPHTVGVASGVFWTLAGSNTTTGFTDFSGGQIRLPESTVGTLPAASSNAGKEFIVTDGASTCDTITGSGSTRVFVQSNGTSWVAPNCSPANLFFNIAGSNTATGYTNFSGGQIRLPESTVVALPAASSNAGKEFIVTDGASTCDTITGSGSTRVFVQSNGTSWLAPNCSPANLFFNIAGGNNPTGYTNFNGAQIRLPESTVAALPAASSNTGEEFLLTDGASTCDTITGGGSTRVFVQSNGTSWVAPNCGGEHAICRFWIHFDERHHGGEYFEYSDARAERWRRRAL